MPYRKCRFLELVENTQKIPYRKCVNLCKEYLTGIAASWVENTLSEMHVFVKRIPHRKCRFLGREYLTGNACYWV
jgi:hypothetical protein